MPPLKVQATQGTIVHFAFHSSSINGLMEITPFFASDQRGYFTKTFSEEVFAAHGITPNIISFNFQAHGNLRPHFSIMAQNKIIQPLDLLGCTSQLRCLGHGFLL